MRNRLALFLNDLTLEEILYFESELDRRKEKYRRNYAVLSVQADRPVLRSVAGASLASFTKDIRRYIVASAAAGGGTLLAYSPEISVLLFNNVDGACRTCLALLSGLAELNGKAVHESDRIGLKLGLATGLDTLGPGSPRSVRGSVLVRRANQAGWRSPGNTLLMDENSYLEWPDRRAAVRVPFEIEGHRMYRVIPGASVDHDDVYDNGPLHSFLNDVAGAGIPTIKYDTERMDAAGASAGQYGRAVDVIALCLEAYDAKTGKNLVYRERIALSDFMIRLEMVKRFVAAAGLALVRHEVSASSGV